MAARASEFLTSHRAIVEALSAGAAESVLFVAGDSPRLAEITKHARSLGVQVRRVSRKELRRFAPDSRDCALELRTRSVGNEVTLDTVIAGASAETGLILVLDHVTDPHNFGAILRSADQFGVDAVVVPGRRNAPLSAVAVQSSAGTAEHVRIVTVANLAAAIREIQDGGFWVYAAEMNGEPVYRTRLAGRTALVMGSEGRGVSRLVAERADGLVSVPMGGHADSLNVSVACGVLLYEIRRQQDWFESL
jgi:23S rRNA (guanosine2251-2'-O)-methyltransferase